MSVVLPKHGRVIIIDDKRTEVSVLEDYCSRCGIPYNFIDYGLIVNGKIDKYEDEKKSIKRYGDVRLVFLDVKLEEGVPESKNAYSAICTALDSVITKDNGPYGIVLWTNQISLQDDVKEYIYEHLEPGETEKPTYITGLDKKNFMLNPEVQDQNALYEALDTLQREIEKQLNEQKMMQFLVEWENAALDVPGKLLSFLFSEFDVGTSNEDIENLLMWIVKSENEMISEKDIAADIISSTFIEIIHGMYSEVMNQPELIERLKGCWKIRDVLHRETLTRKVIDVFIDILRDAYSSQLSSSTIDKMAECLPDDICVKAQPNKKIISKVNRAINIDFHAKDDGITPGRVYEIDFEKHIQIDPEVFQRSTLGEKWNDIITVKWKGHTPNNKECPIEKQPIVLDITPNCDAARNKGGIKRIVYGYLVRFNLPITEDWGKYEYKNGIESLVPKETTYVTPEFYNEKGLFVLALNRRYLSFVKDFSIDRYLFKLNNDLSCDIRTSCGDTISRIGIRAYSSKL